jgi:organic hydroperoxide reductase OsmC/OhrA
VSPTPEYSFRTSARWTDGSHGIVEAESVPIKFIGTARSAVRIGSASAGAPPIEFASPPEFYGDAGFWTPEHFLVAAVASCFITTFRVIAELAKFVPEALEVHAEGVVEKTEKGYRFTRIRLRPILSVRSEKDREQGARLLEKAGRACLVSHSLASELEFVPAVQAVVPVCGSGGAR